MFLLGFVSIGISHLEFSTENGNSEVLVEEGPKDDHEPEQGNVDITVGSLDYDVQDVTPAFQGDDLVDIDETVEEVVEVLSVPLAAGLHLATEEPRDTVARRVAVRDVLGG